VRVLLRAIRLTAVAGLATSANAWRATYSSIRVLIHLILAASTLLLVTGSMALAESDAKITGLGSVTCQRFLDDKKSNAILRRDYMAWAQGFLSGIRVSQAAGIDDQLNLSPVTYDLVNQLHFLEDYCERNAKQLYSNAVAALYQRLREEESGSTKK
jgi:hypothetical protein